MQLKELVRTKSFEDPVDADPLVATGGESWLELATDLSGTHRSQYPAWKLTRTPRQKHQLSAFCEGFYHDVWVHISRRNC